MKKKYLLFLSALLVAALSIGLVACGDDDEEEGGGNAKNVLVGTWTRQVTGECRGTERWTFNSNGRGLFYMNTTCNSASEPFSYSIITYSASSHIGYARLIYDDGTKIDNEFTVNGNTLHIAGANYTK